MSGTAPPSLLKCVLLDVFDPASTHALAASATATGEPSTSAIAGTAVNASKDVGREIASAIAKRVRKSGWRLLAALRACDEAVAAAGAV